ncbi:hypothetical protein DPMN_045062 [Dreissena polymorpha]|uniref:Uncharacterized protein n=1 Tax=Dreissena polymorpha TaxID=45954 RepID=A0A9D4HZD6_DREPO|nr:hypothetical protein DPMN_045062 [Dreissena polymorpha]
MEDGRLPKEVMYDQLVNGTRHMGRPVLRYKGACKRNLQSLRHRNRHLGDSGRGLHHLETVNT